MNIRVSAKTLAYQKLGSVSINNRIDFAQRFQAIVDRYNAETSSTENYFEELLRYTEDLKQEEERHIRLGLTEDELELFDILKKDKLTKAEEEAVKLAAKSLIQRLREAHPKVLVQDWYKDTQSKQRVRTTVEEVLDQNLPDSYDRRLFKDKCESTFDLILDFASHGRKWAA